MVRLPASIGVDAFGALQQDTARWRDVVAAIARRHSAAPVTPMTDGTVLVALVGDTRVVKLYPPFLRDHFEFECEAMVRLHGRLPVPTPRLVEQGERDGWPWIVMTQLAGTPLAAVWPMLDEDTRCALLGEIGRLAVAVQALQPGRLAGLSPAWELFIARQRERCRHRQQRTGLPGHLLAQLDDFLGGPLPAGPGVILTGEYTPQNLLHGAGGIAGMFDFGDGLVGPREYDWLGPLCFLAAGDTRRCDAFMSACGAPPGRGWRLPLLRLLLLHRYSHLRAQIACPGWDEAADFDELARRIWP